MTLSLVLTINNRSPEVSRAVADSFRLPGNAADEAVIVLDRPTQQAREGALSSYGDDFPCKVTFVEVEGPQGWLCPARAWNAGYTTAGGDLLYCISSEVVQDAENVQKARDLSASHPNTAIFGACRNSEDIQLVEGAAPGFLTGSILPRPLGFIACMPRKNVLDIGGCDEDFMEGLCYEDDDFYLRLWRSGLNFIFDDSIRGVHIHHERPVMFSDFGQRKVRVNQFLMMKKHGSVHVWQNLTRIVSHEPGRTVWTHV